MKRIIYSIYVDIPADQHYGTTSKSKWDTEEKAEITVDAFKVHYERLVQCKKDYADKIGVIFKMYTYDSRYRAFEEKFKRDFPEVTGYEIINFYKLHVLEQLAQSYDEILYLDFDAIPMNHSDNYFDAWDLSKGMCVLHNNDKVVHDVEASQSIRSPSAKYYNCQAMLLDGGYHPNNDVINTGIILANKEQIKQLDYFNGLEHVLELMTTLRGDNYKALGLYPENIVDMFRYDNETIFSYKLRTNKVPVQWLGPKWHYFFDNQGFIPSFVKVVHAICKDFDCVWRKYDA
jgi:hypothetical protein